MAIIMLNKVSIIPRDICLRRWFYERQEEMGHLSQLASFHHKP